MRSTGQKPTRLVRPILAWSARMNTRFAAVAMARGDFGLGDVEAGGPVAGIDADRRQHCDVRPPAQHRPERKRLFNRRRLRPRPSNHGCPWIQKSSERATLMLRLEQGGDVRVEHVGDGPAPDHVVLRVAGPGQDMARSAQSCPSKVTASCLNCITSGRIDSRYTQ